MRRGIIILLFLVPFCGNAQFNLEVEVIDLENNVEIPSVNFSLGSESLITHYGYPQFNAIDVARLKDTLFIEHIEYKFEALPLISHNYEVVGNTILLKVYGRKWNHSQVNLNLLIAKSKKIKNDTVHIHRSWNLANTTILFEPTNHDSKNKTTNTDPFKRAYDDLEDGYFILKSDTDLTRVPFKKEDWYQELCLKSIEEIQTTERELYLLKTYFQNLEQAELKNQKVKQEHRRELNDLNTEIEELKKEIRNLKGLPNPLPTPLDDEIGPPDEVFYEFVNEVARPLKGFGQFKSEIPAAIAPISTKFSGNITLKISVKKDGKVRVRILHSGKDKRDVAHKIRRYIEQQDWKPAYRAGRPINSDIILSVNVGVFENKPSFH